MAVGRELTCRGELFHWSALPTRSVTRNPIENTWFKDKKCSVYPTIPASRLFSETRYVLVLKLEITEAGWRTDCGYSGELAMGAMKCDETMQVHIG